MNTQEELQEIIGKKVVEYCEQYKGTDKHDIAMLAIEFGYQLAVVHQEENHDDDESNDLLEVAELYKKLHEYRIKKEQTQRKEGFIDGAKWQQKRSYSEDEVEDLIYKVCGTVARLQGITINGTHIDTAYKQHKKQ